MSKLYIEDGEIQPCVVILDDAATAPVGFSEKTSIEDWSNYGPLGRMKKDVEVLSILSLRGIIKALVATKGFATCTPGEKIVASQWFVVDKVDRDTVRTAIEQDIDGEELLGMICGNHLDLCLFTADAKLAQITIDSSGVISSTIL